MKYFLEVLPKTFCQPVLGPNCLQRLSADDKQWRSQNAKKLSTSKGDYCIKQ